MSGVIDVAVTGIGATSAYGAGCQPLLDGLREGRSGLQVVDASACPLQRQASLGVAPDPAIDDEHGLYLSRTDRLAVAAAREAWHSAGFPASRDTVCPVVVASTVAGLSDLPAEAAVDPTAYYRTPGAIPRASSYPVSHVAEAVARCLGIRGIRVGVSVACASGAIAIVHAARMIAANQVDLALAGGSDAISGVTLAGFNSLRALDPDPCRPFDRARVGLNLGEGAGMLVLESLGRARARNAEVLAVLRGWALTNDAFHPTAPDEDGRGLASAIRQAIARAGVSADDIAYVNAHGTGTPLNDIAETRAYELAFAGRSAPIPVSSTKSGTGHTLAAAGAIEAIVTVLALGAQFLPATLRLTDPIETSRVDFVATPRPTAARYAMSVSAGFGSSNAALIFERAKAGSVQ